MTEDFTKKSGGIYPGKGPHKPNPARDLSINHETGMMYVPGVGELPLVGPTSGADYERLKVAERDWRKDKAALERLMRTMFICTQCKEMQWGRAVRVKIKTISDTKTVIFVCHKRKCDAPVVPVEGPTGQGMIRTNEGGAGIIIP